MREHVGINGEDVPVGVDGGGGVEESESVGLPWDLGLEESDEGKGGGGGDEWLDGLLMGLEGGGTPAFERGAGCVGWACLGPS